MVKNFLLKRGDQLAFSITFTSATPVTAMEFGVKEKYSDDYYKIIKSLYKKQHNVVFIGDSYAEGYTPDGKVKGWPEVVVSDLDITNYVNKYKGGTGFINILSAGSFMDLLSQVGSSNEVTEVIAAGGYNDRVGTKAQIIDGITSFCNLAKTKFPNASILIGMVGWSDITSTQDSLRNTIAAYKEGCSINNVIYMNDAENSIHSSIYFSSDKIHPNQAGENKIAENIEKYLPDEYAGGITKISDTKYQINIPSSDMQKLDAKNYVYDLRIKVNSEIKTPLSGKLMIKETVFED